MANKTAMQMLIDQVTDGLRISGSSQSIFAKERYEVYVAVKDVAEKLLEEEKKQIIQAVKHGFNDAIKVDQDKTFETYYQTTYQNK